MSTTAEKERLTPAERSEEHARKIADLLIDQMQKGTALWQQPWKNARFSMPYNATTENPYRGSNALYLWATSIERGYSDGRWCTFNQAKSIGAQIRKGEHGTAIVYPATHYEVIERNENGKPILDAEGNAKRIYIEYDQPRMKYYTVFNAAQIDGMPPAKHREPMHSWERHERAEAILRNSGARIEHSGNKACYFPGPGLDYIMLPNRDQFPTADKYYATAMHELSHWSGSSDRLGRDQTSTFGSPGYAREELRAQISSMMIGQTLEIGQQNGHEDPGQSAAYVASWIRILKDDPKEILRACNDASKIQEYIMQFDPQKAVVHETEHVEEHALEAQPLEAAYAIKRDTQYLETQQAIIKEHEYAREEHGYNIRR